MSDFGLFSAVRRGLATSTAAEHRYPYDKPTTSTANRGGAAGMSSQVPRPAKQHRFPKPTEIEETILTLINQLRHNRHMKQIWEVAVKRNSMTTSLALLGGVLVADTLFYPGTKKSRSQHAVLQTNLAPAGTTTSSSISSSNPSSQSSSSSSHPGQHSSVDVGHHAAGHVSAHA